MAHYVVGIDNAASGMKVAVLDASLRGVEMKRLDTVPWPVAEVEEEVTGVTAIAPTSTGLSETHELTEGVTPVNAAGTTGDPHTKQAAHAETLLAQQLANVCRQMQLGSAELHMGWDGNRSSTRVLSFPLGDLRKIDTMLEFELEDQLASKLDEVVYTQIPVFNSKDKTDMLVATTERAPVQAFLDATAITGTAPRSLFLESLSLLAVAPTAVSGMIVDIGHTKTHVLIVHQGKALFSRTLREGGRRVDQAIARAKQIDEASARALKEATKVPLPHEQIPDEALHKAIIAGLRPIVVSLKQSLLPFLGQLGPGPKLYLTGGMAMIDGLDRYLGIELAADAAPLPLPAALADKHDGHRYTLAYSLAITGASSARQPRLDFRVGAFSFRGDMSGLAAQGQRWAMGIAIILALAFTAGVSRYAALRSDENKLDEQLKQVTKTMMGREMSDFKQAITAIRQSVNPEKSVLPRFSALDYFSVVSQRIAPEIDVKVSEIELRQDKIHMKGDGLNFEMVDKAVEALKGHECFKAVIPGKTRKTPDGLRVEFSVQIDLSCGST